MHVAVSGRICVPSFLAFSKKGGILTASDARHLSVGVVPLLDFEVSIDFNFYILSSDGHRFILCFRFDG